jgi:hypothetical protein
MILYSPARGEKTTWQIRADSVRVANETIAQTTKKGTPRRYDAKVRAGVSDHWPLVVTLELSENQ